jgi:hypothetical protein
MCKTKKTTQHTDSLKRKGVQFPAGATDFSVLLNVHVSLGVGRRHLLSYSIITGSSFPGRG